MIEAGPPDEKENIHVPAAFGTLFKTDVDWDYATFPEAGCNNRMMYMPRGKTLGGSSSINAMVYIRGNRVDYDGWGDPAGATTKFSPTSRGARTTSAARTSTTASADRSPSARAARTNPMADAWVEAAIEAGLEPNEDFNAAAQDGVGRYQTDTARRHALLGSGRLPAPGRRAAEPDDRDADARAPPADGRHPRRRRGRQSATASRSSCAPSAKCMLCAGAYNSPQLLLLSGIGPAEEIELREIEPVLDLPEVGRNLQDHVQIGGIWTTEEPVSLILGAEPEYQEAFAERGEGPLTSNVAESGGFWRSRDDLDAPDLQFHCAPVMFVDEGLGDAVAHGISFGACLLTPESTGTVSLRSNDPTAKPAIRHNFYGEPDDVERVLVGLRKVYEISRQGALAPYCRELFVGPESDSDDDLRAHMSRSSQVLYHPSGTCAMGTVVDSELRVRGTEGLRVVDCSVLPNVVRGNTNAPTIMIGERAADLIRGRTAAEQKVAEATA